MKNESKKKPESMFSYSKTLLTKINKSSQIDLLAIDLGATAHTSLPMWHLISMQIFQKGFKLISRGQRELRKMSLNTSVRATWVKPDTSNPQNLCLSTSTGTYLAQTELLINNNMPLEKSGKGNFSILNFKIKIESWRCQSKNHS
jgi:hypothetical protein